MVIIWNRLITLTCGSSDGNVESTVSMIMVLIRAIHIDTATVFYVIVLTATDVDGDSAVTVFNKQNAHIFVAMLKNR